LFYFRSVRPKRKDIKSFIKYFKKNDCFEGFYKIYLLAKKSNFNTNLFPTIAHLFKAICTSFLAQSLKKNLFKNKDYQEALNSMYDFFKIKKKVDISPSTSRKSSPPLEKKN
jgi:ribosomal protein L11 methylase PrmA